MTSPLRQYRRITNPVHTMNEEIAAELTADPEFLALVPGGVYTEPIRLDQADAYPEMFARDAPGQPADDFRTNVAVLALQRVAIAGLESHGGVMLYSRLEVRGPRGPEGRAEVMAVCRALDGLNNRRVRVGTYRPTLETLGDYRPPVDDPANELGLYSWFDVRARLMLS